MSVNAIKNNCHFVLILVSNDRPILDRHRCFLNDIVVKFSCSVSRHLPHQRPDDNDVSSRHITMTTASVSAYMTS